MAAIRAPGIPAPPEGKPSAPVAHRSTLNRGGGRCAALAVAVLLILAGQPGDLVGQTIAVSTSSVGPAMTITTAVAGSAPTPVTVSGGTYDYDNATSTNRRISAKLSSAMPSGATMEVQLAASKGNSRGWVALSTTAQDVVISIPKNSSNTGQAISYRFSATSAAGLIALSSRSVTLTIY